MNLETDIDACGHLTVDFEPISLPNGDVHAAWYCRDCPESFIPAATAAEVGEEMSELVSTVRLLAFENARLRLGLVVGAAIIIGGFFGGFVRR